MKELIHKIRDSEPDVPISIEDQWLMMKDFFLATADQVLGPAVVNVKKNQIYLQSKCSAFKILSSSVVLKI